jgi:hypothetical protein
VIDATMPAVIPASNERTVDSWPVSESLNDSLMLSKVRNRTPSFAIEP